MTVFASNKLLGLDGGENEVNSIEVSVSGNNVEIRSMNMGSLMHELVCEECKVLEVVGNALTGDAGSTSADQYPQSPSDAGDKITKGDIPRVGMLSGFKLDGDFPCKGTMIELSVMERWAHMEVRSQMDKTLRFDRKGDYFNIVEGV
jgi:hypothetical protein